ncbi:hypothetical protein EON65_33085 [archaeon]|nr:MAG: hypothetical protein EON65_33085 [archaeon]
MYLFLFHVSVDFRMRVAVLKSELNNLDVFFMTNPVAHRKDPINIAICIVGQAMRLETETKVSNLVKYNVGNPKAAVYVVGVLDSGLHFSNNPLGLYSGCYGKEADIFAHFEDTFRLVGVKDVDTHFNASKFFEINPKAQHVLGHYRRTYDHPELPVERTENHLRQFDHDRVCLERVRRLERKHNVSMDVLVRTRENSIVTVPFDVLKAMDMVKYSKVLTKGCNGFGGYSDKIWVIPKKYMDDTLTHVVEHTLSGKPYIDRAQPLNSEQLIKAVWDHHGVKVLGVHPDTLPFVDGRCMGVTANSTGPPFFIK